MSNFKKLSFLLYNEGIKLRLQKNKFLWKILQKVFRTDVIAIGRTIYIPDESPEWLESHYAFATISHKYVHYLDRKEFGLMYYVKWWLSSEDQFELEMRAYAVNMLCGFVLNGKFTREEEHELAQILYNNYNFDYTIDELRGKVQRLLYWVRMIVKTPEWEEYFTSNYVTSKGFKNVYDILIGNKLHG